MNDPGYWGAEAPVILVLGQSKGLRQREPRFVERFDEVAFRDCRARLAKILRRIGVAADYVDPDRHFRASEPSIGFASLLRCSLSFRNGKTSGSPVAAAMSIATDKNADTWINACVARWLNDAPPSLRLVVALGLTEQYVDAVMAKLRGADGGSFKRLSPVSCTSRNVHWVFVQHPSRVSENHYRRYLSADASPKRDAAARAARLALAGHPSLWIEPAAQAP